MQLFIRDFRITIPPPPPKISAVNCKLFWEYSKCAVTSFGSETIIFFMQLHFPYIFWDSFQYAFAAFTIIENYEFYAAAVLEIFRINFA